MGLIFRRSQSQDIKSLIVLKSHLCIHRKMIEWIFMTLTVSSYHSQ